MEEDDDSLWRLLERLDKANRGKEDYMLVFIKILFFNMCICLECFKVHYY